MDTTTHSLVGTAVSDAFFRKRLGPVATPFALAVSALPDIDILTYFVAPEYAWAHHRGYSHAFFVELLAAPILGYLGYRLSRRSGSWPLWSLLAVLCLFCHTIFDLITSWGTMPWLPFSNARVSWDVAPILDLFLTSVTLFSFVANRLLRWEKVETFLNPLMYPRVHRHPRRQRIAGRVGAVAVALVACYLLIGWLQNRQTVREARKELAAAGIDAAEVRALPLLFTSISWGIVARDADGTVYNAVYSSYAPRPMRFEAYPTDKGPAVDSALATPDGRLFAWYAQDMYVAGVEPENGGERVTLGDRRFFSLSQPKLSRFSMSFDVDENGRVASVSSRQGGLDGVDLREELRLLWNLTWRGEAFPDGGELSKAGIDTEM